jgi:formylglycine-generating enzyme required for sulfatase activity
LDIPADAVRARVAWSSNLRDWELTQVLPTGGGEWMERPSEGWGGHAEGLLETTEPQVFLRLEIEQIVFMEMVPVGNPGNPPDPGNISEGNTYGAVAYEFSIGRYEVTNAQYTEFLNLVAGTDPNSLYNENMGSNARGGIARSGASGSYTYAVKPNMGDKPVSFVSWYDAVRFCNWLHNGRPTGAQNATTTEGGAYTLAGATSIGVGSDPIHRENGRNAGARFWIPSENEWYKAAYHQPAADGGDADHYWLYPTGANTEPTIATADEFGNINNDTANIANYYLGADWNGQDGNVTTVGSGGPGSASYYGAFDIAGNVWEWNEQIINGGRGLRGGSWGGPSGGHYVFLGSPLRNSGVAPSGEDIDFGFRVAGP